MFPHVRDSIEAHLTIVFAALAVSRYLQDATGLSIRQIVEPCDQYKKSASTSAAKNS